MPELSCTTPPTTPTSVPTPSAFPAADFIAELLQHLPDCRARLIRRYGLYSPRSPGIWLRKPHLAPLTPQGWKQNHLSQPPLPIAPSDEPYPDGSVSARESRAAQARLIAKLYEANPLECGRCGSPLRVVAVITKPQQVRKILPHLIKTGKAPPGLDPAFRKLNPTPLLTQGSVCLSSSTPLWEQRRIPLTPARIMGEPAGHSGL